jgi:hypothetical protein
VTLRVFRDYIERAFILALHYQDMGYCLDHATQGALDMRTRIAADKAALLGYLREPSWQGGRRGLDDFIEVSAKLLGREEGAADRDLIDTIVRVLGFPYARNSLSGQTLTRLRDAILLPEEITKAKAAIAKEAFCAACGHPLQNGEMATFKNDGYGKAFYCTRCARPSYVASRRDINKSCPTNTIRGLNSALERDPDTKPEEEVGVPVDPRVQVADANDASTAAGLPPSFRAAWGQVTSDRLQNAARTTRQQTRAAVDAATAQLPPLPTPAPGIFQREE